MIFREAGLRVPTIYRGLETASGILQTPNTNRAWKRF